MPTTPPPIDPIVEFPELGDPDFNSKAFDWATRERTHVAPQISAVASNVAGNAAEALASANSAAASKTAAAQSAIDATANGAAQVALATTQATNAAASAAASAASATASNVARAASVQAQLAAEAALDAFTDQYLGVKAADPTVDNDGDPVRAGAFYVSSATGFIRAFNGTTWVQGISAIAGVSSVNGQMGDVIVRAGYDSRRITSNTTLNADTAYETGSGFAVAPSVTLTVPANTDLVIHRRAAGTVL